MSIEPVKYCESCGHREVEPGESLCQYCDSGIDPEPRPAPPRKLSVPDETVDTLVEAASTLTLGKLIKRAKDKGLITPVPEYEASTTT